MGHPAEPCTDCDDDLLAAAVAPHKTATSDKPWSAADNERRLPNDGKAADYKPAYAWVDPGADADTKGAYKFIHHEVGASGTIGAANTRACSATVAVLNGGRGGAKIPDADRRGVFNHVLKHLKDSGVADDDLPKLMAAEVAAHMAAAHGATNETHSHPHAAYGQSGDQMHDHSHTHADDANHDHSHALKAATMPLGLLSFTGESTGPVLEQDNESVVVAAMVSLGSSWGIAQTDDGFVVLSAGVRWQVDSYTEGVARIAEQLAQDGERPILAERWRSDMAFEGVDTGDGRYINPGAIAFRDCPLPLMLQTETAPGHMGAVLAGTIEQTGMVGSTAVGSGSFDDSEAGKQFRDIINARGRFGVSIDVAEAEGEFVCTERDGEGDCTDGRMEFSLIKIMGASGTPFPAFADAYIEIPQTAEQGIAASGAEPSEDDEPKPKPVETRNDAPLPLGKEDTIPLGKQEPNELSAAGGPAAPTKAWFENPNFDVNDPAHDGRLVPQPNGGWACPLTVLDNGRVFGHMAPADGPTWRSAPGTAGRTCHTGYAGKCVPPPRSASGYAAFMLRPLMTAEGEVVRVGYITAGCGHLYESRPVEQVRAHYDGGPNAVRMAAICVGEDDFGIWLAGSLCPEVTDEQVRAFAACSVSGDWREVWRGKGLDLVACLGGVTVPGFPVASIAAGAAPFALAEAEPKMAWEDGRPIMLVAAGAVRQPLAWERALSERDNRIDALEERLARAERVAQPLRRLAADAMVDGIEMATAN